MVCKAIKRAASFGQIILQFFRKRNGPKSHHGLALDDSGPLSSQRLRKVMWQIGSIDPRAQHAVETMTARMVERCIQSP